MKRKGRSKIQNTTESKQVKNYDRPSLVFQFGYVCLLETMDYVMYASHDYGSLVVTNKEAINNYALAYALGNSCAVEDENLPLNFPNSKPSINAEYQKDFTSLQIYITPATPDKESRNKEIGKPITNLASVYTKIKTYNTIPERFEERFDSEYAKIYPSYGRYEMIAPESRFIFVIFSVQELNFQKNLPRYIRLGKFKAQASLKIIAQGGVSQGKSTEGEFYQSESLHYNDLPPNFIPHSFDLIRLGKAHAVLINITADGEYWELKAENKSYKIPQGTRFCNKSLLT